jgi:hypothetical protein
MIKRSDTQNDHSGQMALLEGKNQFYSIISIKSHHSSPSLSEEYSLLANLPDQSEMHLTVDQNAQSKWTPNYRLNWFSEGLQILIPASKITQLFEKRR